VASTRHGFDGEGEAVAQGEAAAGSSVVGNVGVFVHLAADAVAAEVGRHAAAGLAGDGADGVGDVADPVADGGGGDAGVQGLLGGGDEFEVGGARGTDGEADRGVAGPAVEFGSAVDADQVAVAKAVVTGDAVRDGVVDGGADHGGEGGRGEGGLVAQERRTCSGLGENGTGGFVELAQADSHSCRRAGGPECMGHDASGFSHRLQCRVGLDLHHVP
jgi:hypothetical protein